MLKKAVLFLSVCLPAMMLFSRPTDGYVMGGPHALQRMMESINLPASLLVRQKLILFDSTGSSQGLEYDQLVRYRLPEQYRSDIESGELKRVYIASADSSLTFLDDRVVSTSDTWMDHYKDVFFYRSRERLEARLRKNGVDVSVTSLGRFEGKIALVIGAKYPDESRPQLWIEKEGFKPLRWIFRPANTASGDPALEIRYTQWQNHFRTGYPVLMDFLEGDRLVCRIQVESMELNPGFSERVFDLQGLQEAMRHPSADTPSETENSDIKKKIDEFRKIFE